MDGSPAGMSVREDSWNHRLQGLERELKSLDSDPLVDIA